MDLRPGYKQTDVGVIPKDWVTPTIQELLDRGAVVGHLDGNHGDLYPRSNEFKDSGVPYVTANDLSGHRVDFGDCRHLSKERAHRFRKGVAKDGDVLFAHNATVGPTALLSTELESVILSTTLTYFRCNPEKLLNTFLLHALQSRPFVDQYRAVMAQSTRNQVPITAQRKLSLPLPPTKHEQAAIARVLSDADALVESIEQLLAKKRQIKQGAMQELLTGKKRLPGFSGNWEVKSLGELADIRSGGTPSTTQPQFWNGDVPWCTPTDVTSLNGFKYLRDTSRKISHLGLKSSSAEMIPAHSVVMTSRATIGECAINQVPVTTNQGFKNFVPFEQVDVDFLYYLLITQRQGLVSLCGGSTFLEIGKTQVAAFTVRVPSAKVEQTAIAAILTEMDAAVAALEAKLAKTRALKQAMMQELLTGRIRLA